jgi:putative membrane protein
MKMAGMKVCSVGAAILLTPLSMLAQVPPSPGPAQSQSGGQVASNNPLDSSMNGSAGADTQLMKDRMFVRKAAEDGYAEVQFGQLAIKKSASDDVKKLGQKMVDDRKTVDDDLKPAADELGVRTPTKMAKADQEEFDKLNVMSGEDFDKEYLAYSLKSHRKNLHEFRTEETLTSDPQLKDAVASLQPVIVGHLYMVNKLAVAKGVPGAHKGPPPATVPPPAAPQQ